MAGIQEVALTDFSGGIAERLPAASFERNQWSALKGFVLESEVECRSQWALQRVASGFLGTIQDTALHDGQLFVISTTGGVSWMAEPGESSGAAGTAALTFTSLAAVAADPNNTFLGVTAIRNVTGQGFVRALIVNGLETGSAYGIYDQDAAIDPGVIEWTNRYPNATTDVAMPRAKHACMWGSFLVLGDIEWLTDDTLPFGATNAQRYGHGLWFSQPGKPDSWDLLDVEFLGVKGGIDTTYITDLIPLDIGLLVVATTGLYLLRGTPDDYEYEELRIGLYPRGSAFWPQTGSACYVTVGQVWHTDGRDFLRIDHPLDIDYTSAKRAAFAGWGEFLLFAYDGRLFCFRGFDEDGAWTELVHPGVAQNDIFKIVPGLESCYLIIDGDLWRFNRKLDAERGMVDGANASLVAATGTLESGSDVTFWHRAGARLSTGPGATGAIEKLEVRGGPWLEATAPTLTRTFGRLLEERDWTVVPAHGPSREASIAVTVTGDVEVEQFSVWHHRGKGDR